MHRQFMAGPNGRGFGSLLKGTWAARPGTSTSDLKSFRVLLDPITLWFSALQTRLFIHLCQLLEFDVLDVI